MVAGFWNFTAGKPPVRQPIVLALEQVVQGQNCGSSSPPWIVGRQPALDHFLAAGNGGKLGLAVRSHVAWVDPHSGMVIQYPEENTNG
jgi:hypothetical protein